MPHSISNLQTLHFPHHLRQHRRRGAHARNQGPPSCSALGHHSLEQCIGAIFHYRQTAHDRRRPTSCRAQRRHSQCKTRRTQVPVCSLWIACLPYHLTKKFINYIIFLTRLRLLTQAHKLYLFTLLRTCRNPFGTSRLLGLKRRSRGDRPTIWSEVLAFRMLCVKLWHPCGTPHFTFYTLHSSGSPSSCGGTASRRRTRGRTARRCSPAA